MPHSRPFYKLKSALWPDLCLILQAVANYFKKIKAELYIFLAPLRAGFANFLDPVRNSMRGNKVAQRGRISNRVDGLSCF